MNFYTVTFRYNEQQVNATDSDMAVIKAAEQAAEILTVADRGELVSITLHTDTGDTVYEAATTPLPSRRQAGLSLSYVDGDLFVTSFGYASSLMAASNEGELMHERHEPKILSDKRQRIVDEWMDRYDDYFEANGWQTWSEVNG